MVTYIHGFESYTYVHYLTLIFKCKAVQDPHMFVINESNTDFVKKIFIITGKIVVVFIIITGKFDFFIMIPGKTEFFS